MKKSLKVILIVIITIAVSIIAFLGIKVYNEIKFNRFRSLLDLTQEEVYKKVGQPTTAKDGDSCERYSVNGKNILLCYDKNNIVEHINFNGEYIINSTIRKKEVLFDNTYWQAVDNVGNSIEGSYIKFSNQEQDIFHSQYTFDLYEGYELVAGLGTYEMNDNNEAILTSNPSTDFIWKYDVITCSIIDENLHCDNGYVYKKAYKEITDRLDTVTLRINESAKIKLGNKQYTLKLLKIDKDPAACIGTAYWESCTKQADYGIDFSINDIVFALDSNLNTSAQIITVNFGTDYVIYYIPKYNGKEATFFIEKDPMYQKETNLIIGNYIVYVDDNNKVIDINTFTREVQTWGKNMQVKI